MDIIISCNYTIVIYILIYTWCNRLSCNIYFIVYNPNILFYYWFFLRNYWPWCFSSSLYFYLIISEYWIENSIKITILHRVYIPTKEISICNSFYFICCEIPIRYKWSVVCNRNISTKESKVWHLIVKLSDSCQSIRHVNKRTSTCSLNICIFYIYRFSFIFYCILIYKVRYVDIVVTHIPLVIFSIEFLLSTYLLIWRVFILIVSLTIECLWCWCIAYPPWFYSSFVI